MNKAPDSAPSDAPPPVDPGVDSSPRRRLWFRAACAIVPFVVILLVLVTVTQTSSKPTASSAGATHSVPGTSVSSGGAHGTPASTSVTSHDSSDAPQAPAASSTASGPSSGSAAPSASAGGAASDSAGIAVWVSAHSELLGELRVDVTNMDADVANQEFPSLPGDCARLQQDLQSAQSVPQVPNAFDQALWGQALGDFAQAISECPSGSAVHNDVSVISEASQNTSSGELVLMTMLGETKDRGGG